MITPEHELATTRKAEELHKEGWRVFILSRKSPDAIAVKDGKVIAVEILRGNASMRIQERKREDYQIFDSVIFGFHNGGTTAQRTKHLNLPLDDADFDRLEKAKGGKSWHDFVMELAKK